MLHCLNFIDEVLRINRSFNLDINEIKLLNCITKLYFSKQPVFIIDLVCESALGSRPTVNKYIESLVDKHMLSLELSQLDGRTKAIFLTKMAILRHKELDRAVKRAVRGAHARSIDSTKKPLI